MAAQSKGAARGQKPAAKRQSPKRAKQTGLTPLQERFVHAYIQNDYNATKAYKAASPGVSDEVAGRNGHRLLKNADIATAIEQARKTATDKLELTTERVLREIARLAFLDPAKLLDETGKAKPLHEVDADTRAAIAGLEVMEVGGDDSPLAVVKKYKLADKNAALEKAAKHLGLYERDNKQKGEAEAQALAEFLAHISGQENKLPVKPRAT